MHTGAEQWRAISGYEGLYEVSDHGRVRNLSGHIKSLNLNPVNGYTYVTLCRAGRKKTHTVHGIVARAFVAPPAPGFEVCHVDGDKTNNAAGNLRWDSRSANSLDKWGHGTMMHGEGHANHVLTVAQVLEIRRSGARNGELASTYGVTPSTINSILNRKTWRWLTEDYEDIGCRSVA